MSEAKHTPGPWGVLGSDAQGPFAVMHPTLKGVAIAVCDNAYVPVNGFHSPTVDTPEVCAEASGGTTYRPERVANVRLIAAAPDLKDALMRMVALALGQGICNRTVETAMAALYKATGDEQYAPKAQQANRA